MELKHSENIGNAYGTLTLISLFRKGGRTKFMFKCSCGAERTGDFFYIKNNPPAICNCETAERTSVKNKKQITVTGTRLYKTWDTMKQRCFNPKSAAYKYYGGRGIKVCEEWLLFQNFEKWAMANGYENHLTINRKENDGNYEPSNCNWITNFEQQANTSNTVRYTFEGETFHVAEWARRMNIRFDTMKYRFKNMPIEKALLGYKKGAPIEAPKFFKNRKTNFTNKGQNIPAHLGHFGHPTQ